MKALWHKLLQIISIERLVWCVLLVAVAAVSFTVGLTTPALPGYERKEAVKIIYVDKSTTTTTASRTETHKTTAASSGLISLNSATKEQLMSVPGIGEAFAERILTYREENGGFADISELRNIQGVGESRYKKWKGYFSID